MVDIVVVSLKIIIRVVVVVPKFTTQCVHLKLYVAEHVSTKQLISMSGYLGLGYHHHLLVSLGTNDVHRVSEREKERE